MIIRNSCLASMDLNKCGTSRGGIRCKWGDNQTWSRNPQKHLWRSKWSRAPVSVCMCPHQINFSIQLFSTQWPSDQPCPAPNCLARQLWLSRTCNLDHGSKARYSTFQLIVRKTWYFRDELFSLFNYVNDAHKVAFRGMQALNTSGLLELMESIGATGECQVIILF